LKAGLHDSLLLYWQRNRGGEYHDSTIWKDNQPSDQDWGLYCCSPLTSLSTWLVMSGRERRAVYEHGPHGSTR